MDVSPHPHRPVRQAPLLKLGLWVISRLYFNVPPVTSTPPLRAEVVVLSALRGAVVGLLFRIPFRIFGSGRHIPVLSYPVEVCPSIGRPGGAEARTHGVWRFSGLSTVYLFCGFLHCPRNRSPWLFIPHLPPRGLSGACNSISCRDRGGLLAPHPSPGFYSRMFVVWKTSGSGRPVIDLSVYIRFVLKTPSINLREAYLQVPVHPDNCKCLRFVAFGEPYRFQALLRPLHGSPGLSQGYDSNLVHSPQYRHLYALIPR